MRVIYTFLLIIIQPLVLAKLLYRSLRNRSYKNRILERYGFYQFNQQGGIWLHSVSVGETIAAVPLIRELQNKYPHKAITITTMTPTGSAQVTKIFGDTVQHCYLPYDLPCAMQRTIKRLKPELVIIMETELWPNMIHQLKQKEIPTLLANARLSARSAKGYGKVSKLVKPMLGEMTAIAAQYQADGQRFLDLGLPENKLHVTGSVKFDIEVTEAITTQVTALKTQLGDPRPTWIAASTHQGEDEIILEAHKEILKQYPNALLILVPRHPERFNKVSNLITNQQLTSQNKSELQSLSAETQVLLGDTMGEMMSMFGVSNAAFIGGSLIERGGHNPLEPAAFGLPLTMGPHVFNFASVCDMLSDNQALATVENSQQLTEQILTWFNDPTLAQQDGEKALNVLKLNQGALKRHLDIIDELLN
ncbi:lipid IV(A) 3-deoxy-D-manno-octulosonic acid transferase [Vibrio sp. LaRot3]|uniref:lipid IV(A) 3-deoxy-D-manno-octulosonic acid transferase n=1 Tax=Vibrio sp. LaRot3 TaxID=2998829 RepID=UPI0022CDDEE1|nr:lipid IV(A) 3-deoxy-D-manno-octulosonic acid transferase [Vibrio sp. LaRot3]MDA0149380.1 lipid IV(A) 3-deoxy-D-manno-octulosonic acid transferase [Vibrio sp. LaRot3]